MKSRIQAFFGLLTFLLLVTTPGQDIVAQVTWDAGGDGTTWHDADNWSGNMIPTATDSVVINMPATINQNATAAAQGLYVGDNVIFNMNGDLNLSTQLTIATNATFNWNTNVFDWPSVENHGTLIFPVGPFRYLRNNIEFYNMATGEIILEENADIYFTDGAIYNEGDITIESGADVRLSGGINRLIQNEASGRIQKRGGTKSFIYTEVENYGTIRCEAGELDMEGLKYMNNGTQLEVLAGATLMWSVGKLHIDGLIEGVPDGDIIVDCNFESNGGVSNISGKGLKWFRGALDNNSVLSNTGLLKPINGNFKYLRDSSILINEGCLELDTLADLYITSGQLLNRDSLKFGPGADVRISGAGVIQEVLNEAQGVIIKNTPDISLIQVELKHYGVTNVLQGELDLSGVKEFYGGSQLNTAAGGKIDMYSLPIYISGLITGVSLGQTLHNCNLFSNTGRTNFTGNGWEWTTGRVQGQSTWINEGLLKLIPGNFKYISDSSFVQNDNLILFEPNADLYLEHGYLVNNAQIDLNGSSDILVSSAGPRILQNNATGFIDKISGTNSTISVPLINHGAISCQSNSMILSGLKTFADGSALNTIVGTTINLTSQELTITGAVSGDGSGDIIQDCRLVSQNGSIDFSGNGWQWYRNDLGGADTLFNLGEMRIIPGSFKYMRDGAVLSNQGQIKMEDGADVYFVDGSWINDGGIELNSSSDLFTSGASIGMLNNLSQGIITKEILATTSTVNIPFMNDGILQVNEGRLDFNSAFENAVDGTLAGNGEIDVVGTTMLNSGITSPGMSPGQLTISGNYVQDAQGKIMVELNGLTAGTNYDQVVSTAPASVEGEVVISLGFQPTVGDVFDIVTAPSFNVCNLTDSITLCYNDEINLFTINCLPTKIELEFRGFMAAPQVICQDVTAYLAADGTVDILPEDVFSPNNEDCGYDVLSLNKSSFDCDDVGVNPVVLTATSLITESTNCMASVTIIDTVAPIASCQSGLIFDLDGSGQVTITAADIDDNSSDACGFTRQIDKTSFDCSDVGSQMVQLTITDPSGNSTSCSTMITIRDNDAPDIQIQDVAVTLNANNGTASISTGMVNNGTSDNCAIQSLTLSQSSFGCLDDDVVTVTFTALDVNGNQSQEDFLVTVIKPGVQVAWVSEMATGNNNGLSKTHAFNDLQDAFEADGCVTDVSEIRLVEGIYKPSNNGTNARISSFVIDDDILIKGGYPFAPGSRNPFVHVTTLSGDIGVSGNRSDNAFHVVRINPGAMAILDGVVIEDGNANGPSHEVGGGIWVKDQVELINVKVRDCSASSEGAGVYVQSPNGHLTCTDDVIVKMSTNGSSNFYIQKGGELTIVRDADVE